MATVVKEGHWCGGAEALRYRAQADALQVEALAKMRLADEYDAAQERGEVMGSARSCAGNDDAPATAADLERDGRSVRFEKWEAMPKGKAAALTAVRKEGLSGV